MNGNNPEPMRTDTPIDYPDISSAASLETPRGPLSLRLRGSNGDETFTVPDPEQMAFGLGLSPAQKYLLGFIRHNLRKIRLVGPETSSLSHDDIHPMPESIQNGSNRGARLEGFESRPESAVAALNFDSMEERFSVSESPSPVSPGCNTEYEIPAFFSPTGVKRVLKKVTNSVQIGEVQTTRHYRFTNRVQKYRKSPSKLRKSRLQNAIRKGNPFLETYTKCCQRYSCYSKFDPSFLFEEYKKINLMNPVQSKRYLISLYDMDGRVFRLKGQPLCYEFVHKVYGFCRDTQGAIKGNKGSRGSSIARSGPREVKQKTKRWYICTFILRLASLYGDYMPHKEEITLPVFSKTMLWKEFVVYWEEEMALHEGKTPSKNYFFRIWKLFASLVKVRRNHGFTVCSRCEMLDSEMSKHLRDEETLAVLLEQKARHIRFVERERESYEKRQALAEEKPEKYFSVILDGADQKNYGLPHFHQSTKADSGHKLKVKVVGALHHVARGNEQLSLYAMTEEYETGANHVIEVAHRMIQRKKEAARKLPDTLFVQVDNCTRENKNRYFMAYMQSLVHLGVFKTVQISFLPIGHTHADIDQSFSSIATHLSLTNAFTFDDLMTEMGVCYGGRARAFKLSGIANYSGLCENSGCLNKVGQFSEYRYFRFVRKQTDGSHGLCNSTCEVKVQDADDWGPFPSSRAEGFLKFAPNFRDTPPTLTKKLPNIAEVNKCLEAAEERIKDDGKIRELENLRDKVFNVREEAFHWNMDSIFELRGDYLDSSVNEEMTESNSARVEETIRSNYGFYSDDFVAVRTEEDENTKFWIARVKNVSLVDAQNRAKKIIVRWYVATGRDPWEAKYNPAFTIQDGERTVYEEELDVECVLLRFESLTTSKKLRVTDKKAIKQMLDAN